MFPPPFSRESIVSEEMSPLTRAYRDVVIYDGAGADDVLYEGPIVVHANGWIELEGNRLLSPSAIHHVDIYDDERKPRDGDAEHDGSGDGDSEHDGPGGGDGRSRDDDRRTNRFSPR